jgi:two-component system sensor histidine kinase/response regulator
MQTALWVVNGFLIVLVGILVRRLQRQKQSRRTSEEQYRIIFETVTDGLIINALNGTVVEANPAACQMHGYTREEFLGQSAAEFVHPSSMHLFQEYVKAISSGREFHCLAQDIRKDGSVFDVEVTGVPFQFRGSAHLLGIVRDITQRKQAQDALLESEELNRRIVEAVPAGIIHVAKHGAILSANAQTQKLLGLPRDELARMHVSDDQLACIHEDGRALPQAANRRVRHARHR